MSTPRTALALVLLLALVAGCSSPEERAVAARDAVQQAVAAGDRAEALAQIQVMRENMPDTPEWGLQLASLLVVTGEAPQAVWVLEELSRRYPERADVRIGLGRAALLVNDMATAAEAFSAVDAGSEFHPMALVLLAQARLGLGDLEGALEQLDEADRLYPDQPAARYTKVITLLQEGRTDDARAALEAIEVGPDEPLESRKRFAFLAARVYLAQREPEPAIAALEPLLEDDPADAQVWGQLLPLYARTDKLEDKLPSIEALVEERPDEARRQALLLQTYQMLGREEEADAARDKLIEIADSPVAFRAVITQVSRGDDREKLRELLDAGLERFPDDVFLRRVDIELLVEEERLPEAEAKIASFAELVRENDPLVEYMTARVELARGDVEPARARLERVVPQLDTSTVQFWLGRAFELSGDERGAERRYQLAAQRDRQDVAPLLALIQLAEQRGDWPAVGRRAQMLLVNHPANTGAQDALITSLVRLGQAEQAEKAAGRLVERFPDTLEPQLMLARAQAAGGKWDEARATLEAAREKFGDRPEIARERAVSLAFAGEVDRALGLVEQEIEEAPDSAELQAKLAAIAFAKGATERGVAATDRALELAPDNPVPLRVRGTYLASIGSFQSATSDLERFVEQRPRDADAWFTLGVVRAGLGDDEGAVAAYRRCAEIDGGHAAARNNLALALAKSGELDEAVKTAQTAYRLADSDPNVIDTLGWLYVQQGLVDRAISLLERAHELAPEQEDVQYHLALAYRQADRDEDARRLLEALRARIPESHRLYAQTNEALRSLP